MDRYSEFDLIEKLKGLSSTRGEPFVTSAREVASKPSQLVPLSLKIPLRQHRTIAERHRRLQKIRICNDLV